MPGQEKRTANANLPEVIMLPPKENVQISPPAKPSVRLDMDRIRSSISRIAPVFRNTPQYTCPPLGAALECELMLKLETVNPIRCFKGRGTETVIARSRASYAFLCLLLETANMRVDRI
jgi:hypothetical protein